MILQKPFYLLELVIYNVNKMIRYFLYIEISDYKTFESSYTFRTCKLDL